MRRIANNPISFLRRFFGPDFQSKERSRTKPLRAVRCYYMKIQII